MQVQKELHLSFIEKKSKAFDKVRIGELITQLKISLYIFTNGQKHVERTDRNIKSWVGKSYHWKKKALSALSAKL